MRLFPKIATLYLIFFMGLLIWIAYSCFARKHTGQRSMDMGNIQQYRNITQGK
jgi:hypothetical protein